MGSFSNEIFESVHDKLAELKKKAWKPHVKEGESNLNGSKFSGTPWLAEDEEWPVCKNCKLPMQLFLQLNLNELPEELREDFGKGMIQMFYCTNQEPLCEDICEAYFPFSESVLVRLVKPESNGKKSIIPEEIEGYFPAREITGWQEIEAEFPDGYECQENYKLEFTPEEKELLYEEIIPAMGDKTGGWPYWVQGVEYPTCPVCGEKMRMVFQIDSNNNLPFTFGDLGCGHITQCSEHKNVLAFGWACA
jgi:uncharacterized protein YwqG